MRLLFNEFSLRIISTFIGLQRQLCHHQILNQCSFLSQSTLSNEFGGDILTGFKIRFPESSYITGVSSTLVTNMRLYVYLPPTPSYNRWRCQGSSKSNLSLG